MATQTIVNETLKDPGKLRRKRRVDQLHAVESGEKNTTKRLLYPGYKPKNEIGNQKEQPPQYESNRPTEDRGTNNLPMKKDSHATEDRKP